MLGDGKVKVVLVIGWFVMYEWGVDGMEWGFWEVLGGGDWG